MISVIIPAYNAENVIGECLKSLLSQNFPKRKYEVIVVDDASTDNTKEIVKKFKKVRLFSQKKKGPAAARNLGVRKSKGNIVLFTDADCVPSKNWIKNMTEPFEDKEVVGVAGTYRTLNRNSVIARFVGYEIEERHKKLKKQETIDFIGTFSAGYRKKIFQKFGGFDENFPIASGEDPDLSFKISDVNLKMVFQRKAFVYHRHSDTLRKFLRKKFWRGFWRILLYKKHTKKMFRHSYTPKMLYIEIVLTGLTVLLLGLWLLGAVPLSLGLISLILTFILTLPFSLSVLKKDAPVGLLSPLIIILRNFFTGLGIVWGGIVFIFKK